MERFAQILLVNAVSATLLAFLVAIVGRRVKLPALTHLLWLLVLGRFVAPPIFEVGLLPGEDKVAELLSRWSDGSELAAAPATDIGGGGPAETGDAFTGLPVPAAPAPSPEREPGTAPANGTTAAQTGLPIPTPSLAEAVVFLDLSGAALLLLLAGSRVVRFRRSLATADSAPPELQERADRLAVSLGLSRSPRIRLAKERIPPLLWAGPGRTEIVLPAPLLAELAPDERDALLTHELAHVRRRDHWIRPFELLVTALFWWHPVAWWARHNLRIAEEKSCDSVVLESLPGRSRAYVEGLLKTLEFLSRRTRPVPGLATGAADTTHLEERLVMIMKETARGRIPRPVRLALMGVALGTVLVFPTWIPHHGAVAEVDPSLALPGPPDNPGSAGVEPVPFALPEPPAVPAALEDRAALPVPEIPVDPSTWVPTQEWPPTLSWASPVPGAPTALLVSPRVPTATDEDPRTVVPGGRSMSIEAMIELRRREILLQRELIELEDRRREMNWRIQEREIALEVQRRQAEIEALRAADQAAEAELVAHRLQQMQREFSRGRERARIEQQFEEKRREIEFELQDLGLRYEELRARGDELAAHDLEMEIEVLQQTLMEHQLDEMRAEIEQRSAELEEMLAEE